jgi:O-antigen/teichoic acid export membrane protein
MTALVHSPVLAQAAAAEDEPSVRVRFAVGALWSVLGAVSSRGLTLAGFVLAGRLLGSTGFGEVGMVQSTQGLFGVLAGGGLGLAATKYVAEYGAVDRARASRCCALALLIAAVCGVAGALVLGLLAGWIAERVLAAPHLVLELRAATGLLLFGAIGGVQTGAIAGLGAFRALALLATLRGACLVLALAAGIWSAGVLGAVLGLVLTEVVAVIANQVVLRRLLPPVPFTGEGGSAWQELGAVGRFGALAVLGSIATTAALWTGNVLLVSQPGGYAALGVFNAAERWRQLLLFLPVAVSPLLLSLLSHLHGRGDRGGYRRLLGVNLWAGVAAVLLPATAVVALAPLAMSVFGEEYRQGATTLILLSASAVAVVANTTLGQVLVSQGAIWWRAALDVLLAGVLVLVAWPAVPHWRDQGLALAHLVAYAATALALLVPVLRSLRQPRREDAPGGGVIHGAP